MLPIGHRSSQSHVSIENCLTRKRRNGRESRTRFNFPDHPDRVLQIAADAGDTFPFVCDVAETYRRSYRRPLQIIWKPRTDEQSISEYRKSLELESSLWTFQYVTPAIHLTA